MGTWHEDRAAARRANEAAEAERRRQDAIAAAEVQAIQQRTKLATRQAETELGDKRRREQRKEQEREQERARARRAARLKALRTWAADHMVDLMIYPLAIFSAIMAIPAMAHFGEQVYNSSTGVVLPVITELGMWAFAFAVEYSRHKHADRPVWALQLGVLVFTAVGGSLNYLDGATKPGGSVGHGIVMGVVSIAGVIAHQLVKASPRRSRAERDSRKVSRHAAAKIAAVRKAVIDGSVARVDDTGTVVLMFRAGDYMLTGKRELDPIAPVGDTTLDSVDQAIAGLLGEFSDNPTAGPTGSSTPAPTGAPVGRPTVPPTLAPIVTPTVDPDPGRDQQQSTPTDRADRPDQSGVSRGRSRVSRSAQSRAASRGRTFDELRAELRAAIADGRLDPDPSAESIRTTLGVGQARARDLRNDHNG